MNAALKQHLVIFFFLNLKKIISSKTFCNRENGASTNDTAPPLGLVYNDEYARQEKKKVA